MSRSLPQASLALAPLLLLPVALSPREGPPEPTEGALRVDAEVGVDEVLGHVAFLASDELGGRFTGSEGGAMAADYLADRLAALVPYGLEPAGDDGGFLQDVGLDAVTFARLPVLERDGVALTYGSEFELRSGHDLTVELDVVLVADVEGAPAEADPEKALYLDMSRTKSKELFDERGEAWRLGWGALINRGYTRGRREVTDPARLRRVRADGEPPTLVVHGEAREAFEAGEVERIGLELGGTVKTAHNVVALLPGALRERMAMGPVVGEPPVNEAVVFSAHYDHLRPGQGTGVEGEDVIYNGADDDASGVAVVLELVEALCLAEERPERDVVVLLATGEEIGLVGTSYYLDHPVVPLQQTVANLNFEMLGRPDALVGGAGKVWLTGFEHTNLGLAYQAAGLDVLRDPRPTQHFFERSDNYAFVLKGIVGQSFSTYDLHEDYHRVTDELETIDGEHLAAATRLAIAAARLTLAADMQISWAESFELPRR